MTEYDENIRRYFDSIKKFKPLTLKQEKQIFKSFKETGDINLRNQILQSNLKWVVEVANYYKNKGVDFAELICEGNDGLMIAIEKYDPVSFDNKFFTYANSWIKYKITDRIKREISINENVNKDLLIDIRNLKSSEDVDDDIHTGVTLDDWINNIPDFVYEDNIRRENNYRRTINDLFSNLDTLEVDILNMSFGTNDSDIYTLKEISDKYDISQERVRQIRDKAFMKMQSKALENNITMD
jgi:RNA polymerase sigma factor (sigma-70 family)